MSRARKSQASGRRLVAANTGLVIAAKNAAIAGMTASTISCTISCLALGRGRLEQLGDRTFECGQAYMDIDHLVRADGIRRVDIGLVLGPLSAALTAVE
ncbi:MAG: hypothetical protein M3003_14505 [Candidatus Dormibacteraeota bacterium]|nr:hypothetical protein [Candidatus Dormibacteraeota bacterium]